MRHTLSHKEEIAFMKMKGLVIHHEIDIAINNINHYLGRSKMAFQFLTSHESKKYDTAVIVAYYMLKCNF